MHNLKENKEKEERRMRINEQKKTTNMQVQMKRLADQEEKKLILKQIEIVINREREMVDKDVEEYRKMEEMKRLKEIETQQVNKELVQKIKRERIDQMYEKFMESKLNQAKDLAKERKLVNRYIKQIKQLNDTEEYANYCEKQKQIQYQNECKKIIEDIKIEEKKKIGERKKEKIRDKELIDEYSRKLCKEEEERQKFFEKIKGYKSRTDNIIYMPVTIDYINSIIRKKKIRGP